MPHKHVRRKGDDDAKFVLYCSSRKCTNKSDSFDLAPSIIAKPLPTYSNASRARPKQKNVKRRRTSNDEDGYKHDDTPRAFARLMHLQSTKKRQRSGLDDGEDRRASKKKRKSPTSQENLNRVEELEAIRKPEAPKILPGERLADFAARVDQALPVGGLKAKGKVKIEGLKERQTKKEKKMHRMYAAWREEDAKRKEKLEEQKELEEDAEAEIDGHADLFASNKRAKKRGRGDEDDPWAELKAKREGRKGLNDVVQSPPNLKAVPKEKFKVKHGAKVDVENVPAAAGSLKKREELGQARREVIERYRAMSKGAS